MSKVILITGASSGIGLETAKLFQSKNWKVAATMRRPENSPELDKIPDLKKFALDVTETESIKKAIADVIAEFGRIDVVVNNAGYGLIGPFEAATDEQIRRQFDTNVFGLMNVCREIIPYFREQKRGTIINITSVGGRVTFPLYSLYHASKWAVEGFSESLRYELEPQKIRVKLIEPGPIKTSFYDRSQDVARRDGLHFYDSMIDVAFPNMKKAGESAPGGRVVADAIWLAATDGSGKFRYGANTKGILAARRILPDWAFFRLIKSAILK